MITEVPVCCVFLCIKIYIFKYLPPSGYKTSFNLCIKHFDVLKYFIFFVKYKYKHYHSKDFYYICILIVIIILIYYYYYYYI